MSSSGQNEQMLMYIKPQKWESVYENAKKSKKILNNLPPQSPSSHAQPEVKQS